MRRSSREGRIFFGPAWVGIYSGYFRDPDGHLWEIMWNPQLDINGT